MAIFRCKMCGGDLEIIENASSCTCDFCGTEQTVPTVKDENLQGLFNRANVLRMKSEFDKAEEIYEKILQSSSTEAEAYWGLILCKYGIEYVEDPSTFKRIPTCHRASYESIMADVDYKNAIQYADVQQRMIYESEAKTIEEVQKGIMALVANEKPYDVFICYKETDENGKRTQDSVIANDIYYHLTQEGFKVFYAVITLEDKLGTEYEPYIFSALNTAKVMLALGTKPEYFNAVWVKNEWSRFLKIMKKDRSKMLIPCYRDMDAYELPEEFAHLQAQDMSKIGFINDVVRGIRKVVVKEDAASQVVQQTIVQQAAPVNSNIQALLDRGNMAIEDVEWEKADGFFEEVLNQDAKCAEAYLGKLLAREHEDSWDSYIRSQCSKYSDADYESVEACPEDTVFIKSCAEKYAVPGYVKSEELLLYFKYDRTYNSELSFRKKQNDTQLREIEEDKVLTRIKQYMSGEMAEQVTKGLEEVESVLDSRIAVAEQNDKAEIARVTAAYGMWLKSVEEKVKSICDEKSQQREADYQNYVHEAEQAEVGLSRLNALIEYFKKLENYKESVRYIGVCEEKIAEIYEKERLNKEERERKAARKKKLTITVASVIAAVIVAIRVFVNVIQPAIKYSNASKALAAGQFEEAIAGFEALGEYEDAAEQVIEAKYIQAKAMVEVAKYEDAIQIFTELGTYKDAADQILEIKYIQAKAMAEAAEYKDAIQIFTELGEYKDAAEQVIEAKYIQAKAMVEVAKYEDAIQIFTELGEYKDAADQVSEVTLQALRAGVAGIEFNFANNTWKVLDSKDGKALLLSKEVIGERPYNTKYEDITWERCTLRKWLNNEYLNSAFDESERNAIVETKIVNTNNIAYFIPGGNDTVDKIFLLSIDEVNKYFTTDEERIALTAEGSSTWWWLRSPGNYSSKVAIVYSDGTVRREGISVGGYLHQYETGGVCPALWVDVSNL